MRLPRKSNRRSARGIALTLLVLLVALGGAAYAVTSTPSPDFSMTPALTTQTLAPGAAAGYGINLQASGSFSDNVSLSVISGLPPNTTATFGTNPAFVDSSLASATTMWVTTSGSSGSSTPAGTYTLTICGWNGGGAQPTTCGLNSGGTISHAVQVTLKVVNSSTPDFSVEATPTEQYVSAGGDATYSVNVRPVNGFGGTVTLSAATVPGAVSLGWNGTGSVTTAQNSSTTFTPGQSATPTLTVATTSQNPPGSYAVTITGASGGIQHTAVVTLNIDLFSARGSVPALALDQMYKIPIALSNPYNFNETVTGLAVSIRADSSGNVINFINGRPGAPSTCRASWFKLGASSLSGTNTYPLPGNSSPTLPSNYDPTITLPDLPTTDQDGCKGVVLELDFVGSAQK